MAAVIAPRRFNVLSAGLAALGIACSALALASTTATADTHRCSPPGQQRSATVARAERPDGTSEVTEFQAGGGYRVTRCDAGGGLLVSQTVAPIADPDGGTVLVPTERQERGVTVAALYGDPSEASWAAAFRAARAALRASVIAPTGAPQAAPAELAPPAVTPPAPAASEQPASRRPSADAKRPPGGGQVAVAAVAGDACSNTQYALWTGAWASRSYGYHVNRSRFNYNDTSVASIVDGHTNWDTTSNSCGLNDITNLTSQYLGSTSATIHTYPDGTSVSDKGNLSSVGCAGALACTWLFTSGSAAIETDQRYNESMTFTNSGAAGAYDYESVATHESGHGIGLDHAGSSDALTMYPSIRAGTTHARTLAKGDVLGLRARYP